MGTERTAHCGAGSSQLAAAGAPTRAWMHAGPFVPAGLALVRLLASVPALAPAVPGGPRDRATAGSSYALGHPLPPPPPHHRDPRRPAHTAAPFCADPGKAGRSDSTR